MSKSKHEHEHEHNHEEDINIDQNALDVADIGNVYIFDGKKIVKVIDVSKTETLGTEAED